MAYPEVEFCIIRDEKEKMIGFSLVAAPQTEGEYFCANFPKALADKTAKIEVNVEVVIFEHPEEGTCRFKIGNKSAKEFKNFIEAKGPYKGAKFSLYRDGFLTPGFKIMLEGMKDLGKKDYPIMSSI